MKGMTIPEMKAKKIEVEAAMGVLLSKFQNETGAEVTGIELHTGREMGVPMPTHFVDLRVEL